MKFTSLLFFFVLVLSHSVFTQTQFLEEFVVLEQYCDGDNYAIVSVVDPEDAEEEYTYTWSHTESTSKTIRIDKRNFGKEFCVERHCPCGSDYTSCFTFDPIQFPKSKSTVEVENVSCFDLKDGSAQVSSVGNFPFSYAWSNGTEGASQGDLPKGRYQVSVTDGMGCEQVLPVRVKGPKKLRIRPKTVVRNKYFTMTKVRITGGNSNYTLNGAKKSKATLISFNRRKKVEFQVEDENGCATTKNVILKRKRRKKRGKFNKKPKRKKPFKMKLKCPKA